MKDYNCDYCVYCQVTNNFYTRWCSYWNKMTFITDGCFRDTTVLDFDYVGVDEIFDLDDIDNFDDDDIDNI